MKKYIVTLISSISLIFMIAGVFAANIKSKTEIEMSVKSNTKEIEKSKEDIEDIKSWIIEQRVLNENISGSLKRIEEKLKTHGS